MQYRDELYDNLGLSFSTRVHFGISTTPISDLYAGKYIDERYAPDVSEIQLVPLPDNGDGGARYAVVGIALFGAHKPNGPSSGEMAIIGSVFNNVLCYTEYETRYGNDAPYSLKITFDGDVLSVVEDNWFGRYGINVSFNGGIFHRV